MTITYTDPLIPCGLPHTTPSITQQMLSTTSVHTHVTGQTTGSLW